MGVGAYYLHPPPPLPPNTVAIFLQSELVCNDDTCSAAGGGGGGGGVHNVLRGGRGRCGTNGKDLNAVIPNAVIRGGGGGGKASDRLIKSWGVQKRQTISRFCPM